jgi:uncharacterized membrane protein YedE/YeeE
VGRAGTAPQRGMLACAAAAALILMALTGAESPRLTLLFAIGLLIGATLYHAHFGFTGAYRRLLTRGEVDAVQAQLAMLALASVLFAPALEAGSLFGRPLSGAVAPAGWQVAIGAFLFGIGMQLGGGCGSGTLYTLGGGSLRMLVTLAAFCAGGFWASLDMEHWERLPVWESRSLAELMGWPHALALQLAVLAFLAWIAGRFGRRRAPVAPQRSGWKRLLAGPWPLLAAAVLLALLNAATLAVAGHPWSITWAFTLWGAKVALLLGWDPAGEPFWSAPFQRAALQSPVLSDITSVMNIGMMVGALAAAAAAGRFAPRRFLPARALAAAVIGGLLMGYGARLAYGCNIGAFFSGIASTSLHGWLWIAAALPGNWVGVRLRPWFGFKD